MSPPSAEKAVALLQQNVAAGVRKQRAERMIAALPRLPGDLESAAQQRLVIRRFCGR